MSSPEELKVRESLFSSESPGHASDSDWRCSGEGSGGVEDQASEYPRRSQRQDLDTRKTTATSAAYIPESSLSCATATGWKGGRGRPWRSLFARKPRNLRRAIVAAPWTSPIAAHHLAAILVSHLTAGGQIAFACLCKLTTKHAAFTTTSRHLRLR